MRINQHVALDMEAGFPLEGPVHAWYPVQTRYQCEKRVDAALRDQGFETFTPLQREMRRWSDRTKIVESALFPGYTFVRMEFKPKSVVRVLGVPGLVRFVTCGREFAVVPDHEIEGIRTVIQSDTPFEQCPFPIVGEKVRIRGGCLEGVEGVLVGQTERGEVVISVGTIQRSLRFSLGNHQIESLK